MTIDEIIAQGPFGTILVDPPWRFTNRTGKVAPEHRRLHRYRTMDLTEMKGLPIGEMAAPKSHLWLWTPNAILPDALEIMRAWGFIYKTNVVWFKTRKDGGPDGRGVGFYLRNTTELLLLGVKGGLRTRKYGRRRTNILISQKGAHSEKPAEAYDWIEQLSPGPYLEMFARCLRLGWISHGDQLETP